MKKIRISILLLLYISCNSIHLCAQNIDIGIFVGYGFDNIANYNSSDERAVIGSGLWDLHYGTNATLTTEDMRTTKTMRYSLQFKINKKGSISETNEIDKIQFVTTQLGFAIGYGGNIGNDIILYFDGGVSYNSINKDELYIGELIPIVAFPDLSNEFNVKSSEIAFIYMLGIEKYINQKVKWNIEFAGDAGITEINENVGSFRTQGIYLNAGLKYTIGKNKSE